MPPKKRSSKKKAAKEGGDAEDLTPEETALFLERRLEATKQKMVMQTNKATSAEAVVRELRARLLELTDIYEKEKTHTFDIVANMTREYKAMKEEMLKKINELDAENLKYKDQLELKEAEMKEQEQQKDREMKNKDNAILEMKAKMDDMAKEFGQMLKQTLDKMSEKIVITNDYASDQQQDQPVVRTFEDFNLGSSYS
jgi:hypothetical protein